MVDPSLVLTIDRSSLSLSPLVMSATRSDATDLGVVSWREPAMQSRLILAPESRLIAGDQMIGSTLQQTLLSFQVMPLDAASESEVRTVIEALMTAVCRQPSFTVTDAISGAPDRTWSCNPGSVIPDSDRSLVDLKHLVPVWSVSIPAYPIWSA